MKKIIKIIVFLFAITSCQEHKRTEIILGKKENGNAIIYKTDKANFYFNYQEFIDYCKKEDNGEANDFMFKDIIKYIENYPTRNVIIPDTLGTKMEKESEIYFNEGDSLIRVRDHKHPYAYVTDEVKWAIIKFAENGNLNIFEKTTNSFVDTIIIDKADTDWYGETNILLKNDSIIFSQLRWIK